MPTILIEGNSLRRGMRSDKLGISASVLAPPGYYARSNGIELNRPGYEGNFGTARTFNQASYTDASSNINSIVRAVATDITQSPVYVWLLTGGRNGIEPRVIRILSDAYDSHQVIVADGGHNFTTVPSTNFFGEDIVLYRAGATNYVFYSWNDSGDGDVGTGTIGGIYDDNWMSTEPDSGGVKLSGGVPHMMVEGADKKLYITNGRYIAQFDGTTGTDGILDNDAYDLGVGWIATDVKKYGNFLAISSIKTGSSSYINYTYKSLAQVTVWNMAEPHLGLVFPLSDFFVSALYPAPNGELYAFTYGKDSTTKVLRFNGSSFEALWEGRTSVYGTPPYPRSIDMYGDLLCWIPGDVTNNFTLALDVRTRGVHVPFILNDGTTNASTGVTRAGVLQNIQSDRLYIGGLFGSAYKLPYLTSSSTGFTSSVDLRTRIFPLTFNANIKRFRFFFSALATSAQAQFSLFKNYAATDVGGSTDQLNLTLDNATYGAITEYEFVKTITNVSSFWVNIRLTGNVAVRAVEIDWEPSR